MLAALIRLGRILLAQIISWTVLEFAGVNIPYINISVGAAISAIAKYLREKYGWDWLPV
jgi:soluble lytic murein transglycosylase-like protein